MSTENFINLSLVSVVNHWTPTSYFQLLSSVNLPSETLNTESLLVGSIKLQNWVQILGWVFNNAMPIRKILSYRFLETVNHLLNSIELLCAEISKPAHIFSFHPIKHKTLSGKNGFEVSSLACPCNYISKQIGYYKLASLAQNI